MNARRYERERKYEVKAKEDHGAFILKVPNTQLASFVNQPPRVLFLYSPYRPVGPQFTAGGVGEEESSMNALA